MRIFLICFLVLFSTMLYGADASRVQQCGDLSGNEPCVAVDLTATAQVSITSFHWYIHRGLFYIASGVDGNVDIGLPLEIQIETGSKPIHFRFYVTANKSTSTYLIKDITIDGTGTTVTTYNYNQTSVNTSETETYLDPDTSGGTTVNAQAIGLGDFSDFGGISDGLQIEWIIPADSTWLLRVDALEDDTRIGWEVDFYED